jgi:hypothetical protein
MKLSQVDRIALEVSGPRKMTGRCCICGHKVFSGHSIYCRRCHLFSRGMNQRGLHADAVRSIWKFVRKYGYVCYYTGIPLNLKDPKSPWYYEFDHMIPGDDRKIVLTCTLINEMKTVMTEREFKNIVLQLAKHWLTGAKIEKIRLAYWEKRGPHEKL